MSTIYFIKSNTPFDIKETSNMGGVYINDYDTWYGDNQYCASFEINGCFPAYHDIFLFLKSINNSFMEIYFDNLEMNVYGKMVKNGNDFKYKYIPEDTVNTLKYKVSLEDFDTMLEKEKELYIK